MEINSIKHNVTMAKIAFLPTIIIITLISNKYYYDK